MTSVVVRRAPLRNFAGPGPWLATVYLFSYLPTGVVFFACGLAVTAVCVALVVTWLALPPRTSSGTARLWSARRSNPRCAGRPGRGCSR
jgi:hypothetical protein